MTPLGLLCLVGSKKQARKTLANPEGKVGDSALQHYTTNRQIRAVLTPKAEPYKSPFSGEDVDNAVRNARNIPDYLDANVQPPFINFTGDVLEVPFTTVTRTTWLHEVVISVLSGFSKSVSKYHYTIAVDNIAILEIPTDCMATTGLTTVFNIDTMVQAGSTISMQTDSTNAFGDVRAKLVLV